MCERSSLEDVVGLAGCSRKKGEEKRNVHFLELVVQTVSRGLIREHEIPSEAKCVRGCDELPE